MKKSIILVLTSAAALLCSCAGQEQEKAEVAQQAPAVRVKQVFSRDVPQVQEYTSTVQAFAINNIAPQSALRIREINVEIGDYVKAGQVLARMDVANLKQMQLQMVNDSTELERMRSLFAVGAISKSDLEAMELAYSVRKTSFTNLHENTILTSPLDGVISARNYDKGDLYTMGQPLFTVQQITPVKLLVAVSEQDYTKVKKGGKCSVSVDALPGRTFPAEITLVYPVMDAMTHTFNVEVSVPNKDRLLRPGMYAKVTLDYGSSNHVVVPDASVARLQGSGDRYVYVVDSDNIANYRKVILGTRMGAEYEILDGVNSGERVVVEGGLQLKDGIKVRVEK